MLHAEKIHSGRRPGVQLRAGLRRNGSQWQFTWTGFDFYRDRVEGFVPTLQVKGTFSGIDQNHDDKIDLSELTELSIGGGENLLGCITSPGQLFGCGVAAFSYKINGDLEFDASSRETSYNADGSFDHMEAAHYEAGVAVHFDSARTMYHDSFAYFFTPQTVITITPLAAVPEPETYAMLAAGLMLLAGTARRKKQR